jgi:hypothetical protein
MKIALHNPGKAANPRKSAKRSFWSRWGKNPYYVSKRKKHTNPKNPAKAKQRRRTMHKNPFPGSKVLGSVTFQSALGVGAALGLSYAINRFLLPKLPLVGHNEALSKYRGALSVAAGAVVAKKSKSGAFGTGVEIGLIGAGLYDMLAKQAHMATLGDDHYVPVPVSAEDIGYEVGYEVGADGLGYELNGMVAGPQNPPSVQMQMQPGMNPQGWGARPAGGPWGQGPYDPRVHGGWRSEWGQNPYEQAHHKRSFWSRHRPSLNIPTPLPGVSLDVHGETGCFAI